MRNRNEEINTIVRMIETTSIVIYFNSSQFDVICLFSSVPTVRDRRDEIALRFNNFCGIRPIVFPKTAHRARRPSNYLVHHLQFTTWIDM